MEVSRRLANFGVEVAGLDLTRSIKRDDAAALRRILSTQSLILLRGPMLSAAQQRRFANLFGSTALPQGLPKRDGHGSVYVSNAAEGGVLGAAELALHADEFFLEEPCMYLVLHALEVPTHGGDTVFIDSRPVIEAMPRATFEALAGLRQCHRHDYGDDQGVNAPSFVHTAEHGVVHQCSGGRLALWVSPAPLLGLGDMEAGLTMAAELCLAIARSPSRYTHRWRQGDTIIWNNHLLLHGREAFDPAQSRTLRRMVIRQPRRDRTCDEGENG